MQQLLSFSSVMTYIGYIVVAILLLLLMVLIHELGHYTAGKILKFKINEFSVGFGPKILQKQKKNGELITLRLLPLGGYCAFEGEEEEGSNPDAFNNQKPWKRLIVLFFGAFFNFLSAIIFSFILLVAHGYDLVQVKTVGETSINYEIVQSGDVVYGINDKSIDFLHDKYFNTIVTETVQEKYNTYSGSADELKAEKSFVGKDEKTYYLDENALTFNIRRNGKFMSVEGFINVIYDEEGKCVGWSLLSTNEENKAEFATDAYAYTFVEALKESVPFTFKWAWKVLVIFFQLITGQMSLKAVGGPVTTINIIASSAQLNMINLLVLMPAIAANLAVFNLLPIPALDGFQMVFVVIEWIRKKPVKRKIINTINNIGLFVLLGFVILIDIIQFIL